MSTLLDEQTHGSGEGGKFQILTCNITLIYHGAQPQMLEFMAAKTSRENGR